VRGGKRARSFARSAGAERVAVHAFRSPHERERNAGAVSPRGKNPGFRNAIKLAQIA
jgi:hypothetical protein